MNRHRSLRPQPVVEGNIAETTMTSVGVKPTDVAPVANLPNRFKGQIVVRTKGAVQPLTVIATQGAGWFELALDWLNCRVLGFPSAVAAEL